MFLLVMDIAPLALAAHAIVVPGELLAGVYAAPVTAILIGAGMLFLFAFAHWYEYDAPIIGHERVAFVPADRAALPARRQVS
jgi:hypothetical protein